MRLSERIKKLEDRWYVDPDSRPAAVIIHMVSGRKDPEAPKPITKFSFSGQEIHRNDGEDYQDFESRATDAAMQHLTVKHAVPVLLADGGIENYANMNVNIDT